MIAAGVNAKALSTYMGHADISITLDRYGHLMPGNEDEAAGLLDPYSSGPTQLRAWLSSAADDSAVEIHNFDPRAAASVLAEGLQRLLGLARQVLSVRLEPLTGAPGPDRTSTRGECWLPPVARQ